MVLGAVCCTVVAGFTTFCSICGRVMHMVGHDAGILIHWCTGARDSCKQNRAALSCAAVGSLSSHPKDQAQAHLMEGFVAGVSDAGPPAELAAELAHVSPRRACIRLDPYDSACSELQPRQIRFICRTQTWDMKGVPGSTRGIHTLKAVNDPARHAELCPTSCCWMGPEEPHSSQL